MILRTPGGQRQIAIGAISPDNPPGGIEPHTTSGGTATTTSWSWAVPARTPASMRCPSMAVSRPSFRPSREPCG
jgi:hypothetical protein